MKKTARQFAAAYKETVEGKDASETNKLTARFLKIVRAAHAWNKLPLIIAELERLRDKEEGITALSLTTARPVSARAQEEIGKALGFAHARITAQVDPDIIGGCIARTESVRYDASIKTQLQKLFTHLQS